MTRSLIEGDKEFPKRTVPESCKQCVHKNNCKNWKKCSVYNRKVANVRSSAKEISEC
jgi:uncharacterized protein (UPF0179 family)